MVMKVRSLQIKKHEPCKIARGFKFLSARSIKGDFFISVLEPVGTELSNFNFEIVSSEQAVFSNASDYLLSMVDEITGLEYHIFRMDL